MAKKSTKKVDEVKSDVKKGDYSLEIIVNGESFKGEGESLAGALASVVKSESFPQAIKSKVVINYGKGEVVGQRIFPIAMARRTFNIIGIKPEALDLIARKMEISF